MVFCSNHMATSVYQSEVNFRFDYFPNYMTVCPSAYLSIYLSIYITIYLPIYPPLSLSDAIFEDVRTLLRCHHMRWTSLSNTLKYDTQSLHVLSYTVTVGTLHGYASLRYTILFTRCRVKCSLQFLLT